MMADLEVHVNDKSYKACYMLEEIHGKKNRAAETKKYFFLK